MKIQFRFAVAVLLLIAWSTARPHVAFSQPGGVQQLFLGDKTCGDNPYDCAYANVTPSHRYLHVVLHDAAGAAGWQVLLGADCAAAAPATGNIPIPVSTFLEVVVDLSAQHEGSSGTDCVVFRGLGGQFVFYAAYLDDNSTSDAGQIYPGYERLDGRPDLPDLDIAYIHRSPAFNYDTQPNRPIPGNDVTFTAHVLNVGGLAAPPFTYAWSLDGTLVASGSAAELDPRASIDLSFSWRWDDKPRSLTFSLQPGAAETSSTNNSLTIRTDALSLGFWVERSAYNYVNDHEWEYCLYWACDGANSFEDWLQRQVALWNQMLAGAGSPRWSPTGVIDRIRLDKLVIVPDGALPLHGGYATNDPDISDHSVDLQWGLPTSEIGGYFFRFTQRPPPFDSDYAILHELSHARYLADAYRFDVASDGSDAIDVRDNQGNLIYDPANPYDPSAKLRPVPGDQGELLYQNLERDLMSCVCTSYYGAYNALVLNRIQGRPPTCGNYNAPCNLGDWYLEMPPINRIRILSKHGKPAAGAKVRLFFDSGNTYTGHAFRAADSLTLETKRAVVQLPQDPFRVHGSTWVAGHNDLLVEVTAGRRDDFCIVEPTTFNLAYWLGYRSATRPAVYTFRLGDEVRNSCNLRLPKAVVNEPFSTSPWDSTVTMKRAAAGTVVEVRLVDGARHPMRNRVIRVSADGQSQTGLTNLRGVATLHFASRTSTVRVLDVTDNNLMIR